MATAVATNNEQLNNNITTKSAMKFRKQQINNNLTTKKVQMMDFTHNTKGV
ncbi:MAG: hypothetical protein V3U71_11310 [Cocleimonas sp.]